MLRQIYRVTRMVAAIALLFGAITLIAAYFVARYEFSRTKQLQLAVSQISIGTQIQDALIILKSHGLKPDPNATNSSSTGELLWFSGEAEWPPIRDAWVGKHDWQDQVLYRLGALLHSEPARQMILFPWRARAFVRVKNGLVTWKRFDVTAETRTHFWLGAQTEAVENELQTHREGDPVPSVVQIHWFHLHVGQETGAGWATQFPPQAPEDEGGLASEMDLSCLARFSGCNSLKEIYPGGVKLWLRQGSKIPDVPNQ